MKSLTRSVNQVFKIQLMCEKASVCALLWIIVSLLVKIFDLFSKGQSRLAVVVFVYVWGIREKRAVTSMRGEGEGS